MGSSQVFRRPDGVFRYNEYCLVRSELSSVKMNSVEIVKLYSPFEERINVVSHAIGLLLSAVGLFFLMNRAITHGDVWHIVSFAIFGMSMIVLYAASTWYHSTTMPAKRKRRRIVDHASIYVLIAGSYTPFALVTLSGAVGWSLFFAAWAMAITGITLKIFFTGRFDMLSTSMYLLMGWLIVVAIKPLIANLPGDGVGWLIAGGISYTVGAILYSIRKVPLNHAMFHFFVLAGTACHFVSVYFYVLPTT